VTTPTPTSTGSPVATPVAEATAYPAGSLYVANNSGIPTPVQGSTPPPIVFSISIFAPGANGNATPLGTIGGGATGLLSPRTPAVDAAGRIYVPNGAASITVYAPGASGNVAPVETIAGSNTGLRYPQAVALDSTGNIYVADDGAGEIFNFGPFKPGTQNTAPIGMIGGPEAQFGGGPLALTIFDGLIYTSTSSTNGSPTIIEAFPVGTSGTNVQPVSTLGSSDFDFLVGVAFDANHNAYVETSTSQTLDVFANVGGSVPSGNATPSESYAAGQSDGYGPALDSAGNIYVATDEPDAIEVFPPYVAGASGISATRTIAGSNTGLDRPDGVAIH
jgi:hypothetical protein